MDEEDAERTEAPTVRALCDNNWEERVLLHRGKHSRFYRVHWAKGGVWLGLKEEECVDPLATVRNVLPIQRLHLKFILHHYDICVDANRDTLLLVMTELMDYSLSDVMRRHCSRGHLMECQARAIAFLTLHALVDLHDRIGMVHGDLSPSNILLRATGELKLGDLSSAMPVNAAVDCFSGTVLYTAVEVLRDRQWASSPSSDVWALGVALHECVNGSHPFSGNSDENFWEFLSLMEAAMQAQHQPLCPPCFSRDFHDILSAMLCWDPARRPTVRSLLEHAWFSQYSVAAAQRVLCLIAH
ncbi:putative protein kinase [Trypanosoma cruzi]|uniref:Protein kinase domain-containing protein n=2 Tax=Trypanosoma cruzi TaxID=5693 RepID=A0A2V2W760_TRYCR|nr:putative protein kinase [Trypanosoma cruzi]